jgi:hypothetical protein
MAHEMPAGDPVATNKADAADGPALLTREDQVSLIRAVCLAQKCVHAVAAGDDPALWVRALGEVVLSPLAVAHVRDFVGCATDKVDIFWLGLWLVLSPPGTALDGLACTDSPDTHGWLDPTVDLADINKARRCRAPREFRNTARRLAQALVASRVLANVAVHMRSPDGCAPASLAITWEIVCLVNLQRACPPPVV